MVGLSFMAIGFFSLLITLSWGDVSIVGPASASLTFIANALAARVCLKENVDRRRWLAAILVAGGVALLAH
jgi:drug/metabolite transporter (DMT)-like permease